MPFTANDMVETRPPRDAAPNPSGCRRLPPPASSGALKKACDFPVAIAALFSHIGPACGQDAV